MICSFPDQSDSHVFDALYRVGDVEPELVPRGNLAERIRAAGAGIGLFFTPTGFGTALAEDKEAREIHGRQYVLEYALPADVALVSAWRADRWGNLVYRKTARNFGPIMAAAATTTVVQVDEIVELGELDPESVCHYARSLRRSGRCSWRAHMAPQQQVRGDWTRRSAGAIGDSGSMSITGNVGATGKMIAAKLREEILDGSLRPGERIGQDVLARRFEASRIPVRESLKILEAEGLVTIVANSGAWVARLDAFEFDQIYRLRERVEALAIHESVEFLTDEQIARLRELLGAIAAASDVEEFLALDREFHLLTYAGARFSLLHEFVLRFWNSTQHYRRAWANARAAERDWATDAEHSLIVDAIERKDLESAANLVSGHIRRTRLALAPRADIFNPVGYD